MHRWIILVLALGGCQQRFVPAEEHQAGASPVLSARGSAEKLRFELVLDPPEPAVGQLFRVTTRVVELQTGRPLETGLFDLDATMPDHGHGMATQPVHRMVGPGHFLTEGMKLHMPGSWQFVVKITSGRSSSGSAVNDEAQIPFEQSLRPNQRAGAFDVSRD